MNQPLRYAIGFTLTALPGIEYALWHNFAGVLGHQGPKYTAESHGTLLGLAAVIIPFAGWAAGRCVYRPSKPDFWSPGFESGFQQWSLLMLLSMVLPFLPILIFIPIPAFMLAALLAAGAAFSLPILIAAAGWRAVFVFFWGGKVAIPKTPTNKTYVSPPTFPTPPEGRQ